MVSLAQVLVAEWLASLAAREWEEPFGSSPPKMTLQISPRLMLGALQADHSELVNSVQCEPSCWGVPHKGRVLVEGLLRVGGFALFWWTKKHQGAQCFFCCCCDLRGGNEQHSLTELH